MISINNIFPRMIGMLLLLVGLSSCNNTDDEYCLRPEFTMEVDIDFSIDKDLSPYTDITRSDAMVLRYVAYIIRLSNNSVIHTIKSNSAKISVSLPLGKYRVIGWADYNRNRGTRDFYFHSDDLSEMLLVDKSNYRGDDPDKMAFAGSVNFSVTYRYTPVSLSLKPQMGQYKLVANDTANYEVGRVVISYPKGVPAAIDAYSQNVCYHWQGVEYLASYQDDFITSDYIFANDSVTNVTVAVQVFDKNNRRRSYRPEIEIPIIKGGITTCKTKIFTAYDKGDQAGGFGIKVDFDNETIFDFKY